MSVPKLPEVDPELTCDRALNMILSSIAMEEMALSHIINAEGEKLQYVLGTLETKCAERVTFEDVLTVNKSITCLLDSVSQNQMILKSKMDRALCALEKLCPAPPHPPCPPAPPCPPKCPCQCSAVFKAAGKGQKWGPCSELQWNTTAVSGDCVCFNPGEKSKIYLCPGGRFMLGFAVNVRAKQNCKSDAAIALQLTSHHQRTDVYTVHAQVTDERVSTIATSGIIVEAGHHAPSALTLKLLSPDSLIIEDSMFSILEI